MSSIVGESSIAADQDVGGRRWRPGFGQRIPGLVVEGKELREAVFNENEVRAAAGLTMVIGAVAFSYAYFNKLYIPLQAVTSFFFVEFSIRVAAGIRYSPLGVVAHTLVRRQPPQWVSAKPKRFAWSIGLGIALSMTIITNVGIRGYLPRTMCLICLTMMWLESALGICLGWVGRDPGYEVCANGACALPPRPTSSAAPAGRD
jgi:hypothetical protein